MILDNKKPYGSNNQIVTIWNCIDSYTKNRQGQMDIVTGFFSVAALHVLYKELSGKNSYRIVLGDIHDMARDEDFLKRAVDLLQGDSSLESAFELSYVAKNAVEFLKRTVVEVRAIPNSFCHAKSYVYTDNNDAAHDYGIVGSSNLTEAGLGIKASSNIELNIVETGRENATVKELKDWFEDLWVNVASTKIKLCLDNGAEVEKDAKKYLIEQIEQIFNAYTPEEIYYKILFEFFRTDIEMNDSIEYKRDMEFLQKSKIWNTLFDFQKSGVVSLVKLITRYGGAILADAVGLGKTFSALGVIKYFQNNGYHTLILCPKKLRNNWTRYNVNANSRFEEDHFEYIVRSHTDLQDNRLNNYPDNVKIDSILAHEKLLIVVDESHNLRNDKSNRYKMLLNDIINESAKRGHTVKVLLLSATPINTGLIDIRNQFKMIGYNENKHFYNEFNLQSPNDVNDPLRVIFQQANSRYTEWSRDSNRTVNTLRDKLQGVPNFFKLTDELIIARNRAFVTSYEPSLTFPAQLKPQNEHIGIRNIGSYKDMDAMYDDMKILRLTAYQPTQYEYELYDDLKDAANHIMDLVINCKSDAGLTNDEEKNLYIALKSVENETNGGEMMQIIVQNWVVKQSVNRFYAGHIPWDNNVLRELSLAGMMVSLFIKRLESCWSSCLSTLTKVRDLHLKWLDLAQKRTTAVFDDEDDTIDEADIETIGKRTIDFKKMRRIDDYISDLKRDVEILNRLIDNLGIYEKEIATGTREDEKLEKLVDVLNQREGRKIVIFTSYSDTAQYIYDSISNRFNGVELVTGEISANDLEEKLQRFAPFSKLFMEKKWDELYTANNINPADYNNKHLYIIWHLLIQASSAYKKERKQLNDPVNILVATDCVSEGQNLQDADTVINYDIHWNPVRLIQRFGRIDRIGSPNAQIQSVNFWPSDDIESYLRLSDRVSNRMVVMNVAGSETLQANEDIEKMEQNNKFRQEQDARSLRSIHDDKVGEIEDMGTPTFDMLSLSEFKADAEQYVQEAGHLKALQLIPNGAFSGFRWKALQPYADYPECIVALLRHREDEKNFHLLCLPIDSSQQPQFKEFDKTVVLKLLSEHKKESTYLPQEILSADVDTLKKLAKVITDWFDANKQSQDDDNMDDDLDGNFSGGNPDEFIDERFGVKNYDLIAWDYVSTMNN
ncbi:MAG: DEAD/DEAH box helicase family protein [Bacteroidales bacterium]|nr:DEAD/DEAH box helicase family protein [Bacteroidales bacterium]